MAINQVNKSGEDLIIGNEGVKYLYYKDDKGYGTIGIGHLVLPNEYYLKTAHLNERQVMDLFYTDLKPREEWLVTNTAKWITPITQGEFNGLCSFLFQYDIYKYPQTKNIIISGNRQEIINHIKMFESESPENHDMKLVPRRDREIAMFLSQEP
jgi:GH24 family phage-related lysozyme (muramidase)